MTFTNTGTGYVSNTETMASSSALLQIIFADVVSDKLITVERSLDGSHWQSVFTKVHKSGVFDTTLVNGGNGLKIRVTCNVEPSSATCITSL